MNRTSGHYVTSQNEICSDIYSYTPVASLGHFEAISAYDDARLANLISAIPKLVGIFGIQDRCGWYASPPEHERQNAATTQ